MLSPRGCDELNLQLNLRCLILSATWQVQWDHWLGEHWLTHRKRGFKPSAASSTTTPEGPRIQYFPDVHDLASASDVLVVACALNKETRHIVNKDALEALGKDEIVNLS
jgi:hypothetical protein